MIILLAFFLILLVAWVVAEFRANVWIRLTLGIAVAGSVTIFASFAGAIPSGYTLGAYHSVIQISEKAISEGKCDAVSVAFQQYLDADDENPLEIVKHLQIFTRWP